MNDRSFVYVIHIGTTPEKLWEALTNGEFTQQYWGGRRIESDWKIGSAVRHYRPDGSLELKGEVLEYDPPKKLAYTFIVRSEGTSGDPASRVEMTISPSGPETVTLQIVHDQLTEEGLKGISMGWPAILSNLKTLLESGKPLSYYWKG